MADKDIKYNFTLHCLRQSYATHQLEAWVGLKSNTEFPGRKCRKQQNPYPLSTPGLKTQKEFADELYLQPNSLENRQHHKGASSLT